MKKTNQILLREKIADIILDVANLFEEVTTSDLQGIAGAKALEIIQLIEQSKVGDVQAAKTGSDVIQVQYWDSKEYNPSSGAETDQRFLMEIDDQRKTGKVSIDVASENGDVDDLLCATIEINRLPGSKTDTQSLRLYFDGDNLAASFFKQGDTYIIRPETNVSIRATRLPNGEPGWILE